MTDASGSARNGVKFPDKWKDDRSEPYLERYTSDFPHEKEAAAHGLR